MTSNVLPRSHRHLHVHEAAPLDAAWLRYLVPVGRLCFALIFLVAVPGHFSSEDVQLAAKAGVPLAEILVPLSGVLSLLGGLSVLLGYRARVGALLLALFLVPVTLAMHAFWSVTDPFLARMQMIMFMKNLSMLGATLMLMYFGAGPISIDARQGRL